MVSFRIKEVLHSENENSDCVATIEARWFNDADKLESAEFSHWEVFITGEYADTGI